MKVHTAWKPATTLHPLLTQVASQMARPASEFQVKETVPEIEKSCRADLAHFPDPTVQLQLQLQLAITAERYSEASRCELMSSKSNCGTQNLFQRTHASNLWLSTEPSGILAVTLCSYKTLCLMPPAGSATRSTTCWPATARSAWWWR
jgi:hypothetical protein